VEDYGSRGLAILELTQRVLDPLRLFMFPCVNDQVKDVGANRTDSVLGVGELLPQRGHVSLDGGEIHIGRVPFDDYGLAHLQTFLQDRPSWLTRSTAL